MPESFGVGRRSFSLGWLIVFVAALVYFGNVWRFQAERWDDAYITFRFARNLADGQGLIWNSGGERVEGYTSFLHVLLLAAAIKTGANPWLGSLVVSVLSVLATAALILKILWRQFRGLPVLAATAVGVYLLDAVTAVHTASGLETQLFAALNAAALYCAFDFVETEKRRSAILLAAFIFLACLCRPEAVIYGAATYFALMIFAGGGGLKKERAANSRIVDLTISSGLVLTAGVLYALWKYSYFGYLLPNPFYVKSNDFALSGVREVTDYLKHLIKWFAPVTVAAIFLIVTERLREKRLPDLIGAALDFAFSKLSAPKSLAKILLTLMPPVFALCFYSTIIHEVGGGYRFSYPTYFYFALAIGAGLAVLSAPAKGGKLIETTLAIVAALSLAALFVSQKSWRVTPVAPGSFNLYHFQIANALKATELGANAAIICDAAGIIPFVSDFKQIDRVGLTDNFMSGRTRPTEAEREAYIWNAAADVYIGYEPPASNAAGTPAEDALMRSAYVSQILLNRKLTLVESRIFQQNPELLHARMRRLRDDWILIGELDFPGWRAWRVKSFAYVRRASPHREILISSLKNIIKLEPERINLQDIDAP